MKTRFCDECGFADMSGDMLKCTKGHKPRFYNPKGSYPHFENEWGWKRKCAEFEKGTPKGIEVINCTFEDKVILVKKAEVIPFPEFKS